jgi:hypothetical protein
VPVNPSDSRSAQSSGVVESMSTTCCLPFTVIAMAIVCDLRAVVVLWRMATFESEQRRQKCLFSR